MSGFIRRFSDDPGIDVLTEIEGVDIIDRDPPAAATGAGSGKTIVVGEFEDGPYDTPTDGVSGALILATFGGFGFTYADGVRGRNPCARKRQADNALTPEYWNGNAAVQMRGKRYAGVVICRVNTSVGSVQFTRLASVTGRARARWALVTGQTLIFKVNGGGAATATFTGVPATVTGTGATYALSAGDTVTLGFDDAPNFTTTFQAGDTAVATAVSRINTFAGYAFASNSAGQVKLTGRKGGTGGAVRVVSGSTGVLTALGLTAATTAGTGNVADIAAVTFAELKTVGEAAVAGSVFDQLADGTPRASSTTAATGTIEVTGGTATDFGFEAAGVVSAVTGAAGIIPAGTVVQTAGAVQFVTTRKVEVTAGNAGPYSVEVRHALDDGTGLTSGVGTITTVSADTAITFAAFTVSNIAAVTAALTESQIDAKYQIALDATLNINSPAKEGTILVVARQSNAMRAAIPDNCAIASRTGLRGRLGHTRPPLGTLETTAIGSTSPGVGAVRTDRLVYNFPGLRVKITEIAERGTAGGDGFTADGIVDAGSDFFAASVESQLKPEENPGQETDFMGAALGVESTYQTRTLGLDEYKAFKAAGIMAPRFDDGVASFQSGVTTSLVSGRKNVARRRFADYVQDSLALKDKKFAKKLQTAKRRQACLAESDAFLGGLKSEDNADLQRLEDFVNRDVTTDAERRAGIFRKRTLVQMLSSFEKIVIDSTIGETVDVSEVE